MPAAVAAIRLVKDGGTIAPIDLLLAKQTRAAPPASDEPESRLTPRQLTVLAHLQHMVEDGRIAGEDGRYRLTTP